MSQNRIQAYQYFQTDDIPTEAHFQFLFNNLWFKDEQMSISDISGLAEMFQQTLSVEQLQNHTEDENAHSQFLAKLDGSNIEIDAWKTLLEIINTATIDDGEFEGNVYTKEQIQATINEVFINLDGISTKLISNDVNLDNVQEIVDFIKENRQDIEQLQTQTGLNDIVSEDNSLLIEPENKNIESNVSIFSEEFENFTNTIVSISFPAIQILGVYDGGLKLNSNEYELVSPIRIDLLAPRKHTLSAEHFPDMIEVQYTHLKTDI